MKEQPYIPDHQTLPELTFKSIFLGCLISMIVAASNAYLGLFAGMTVSASIPAAVISMAILSLFKSNNILENNAVQTGGSAGASLTAGVIFTIPALVLMGYWKEFNYWETTIIAVVGGTLGVLYTVPLRRALIVKKKLQYPEGLATSEVLKAGQEGGKAIRYIGLASLFGALFKYGASGAKLWKGALNEAALLKGNIFTYFGMNLSPALMAVGYIVGLRIALLVFIGGALSWYIAIPLYIYFNGAPEGINPVGYGFKVWNSQIRFLGVGAMLSGGLWAIFDLRESMIESFKEGLNAFKKGKQKLKDIPRTEQDTPMKWVLLGILFLLVPIFFIYLQSINLVTITIVMTLIMVIAGFLFASVGGYMAGLVGSSNNPTSGVTIATILFSSLVLLAFLGTGSATGAAAAILIGGVVCCGCAIAGDNMQDLKAGYVLGATPYKQQIIQICGVVAAAFVIAPVLNLLNLAYGFGAKSELHPNALPAPQATLMHSVTEGVFGKGLPWNMIGYGAIIGVIVILLDQWQKKRGSDFRIPVLSVAIGIYLPFELDSTILLGGLVAHFVQRFQNRTQVSEPQKAKQNSSRTGLLIASGLITGEALVGILLAIPIAITKDPSFLKLVDKPFGSWPGLLLLLVLCYWVYSASKKAYLKKSSP